MSTVIKVEDISKQYRLGTIGTGTLSHDLNRWWHTVRGKEDPYMKVSEVNDRTSRGASDYVWALRDITFSVQKGEVLGIVGRNGAGKSTLLKILSRTTTPTKGVVKVRGRIASLLEVGTGFHPELTGRENIFLNGAILGMKKAEIVSRFDEIVSFAGVEKYVDTPVKRYSSGMYVRLAFAVAAHLEPEILVVDEVLAVGDADFQKKALGKMKEVSRGEGRTILFVSHNMTAVSQLTEKCVLLDKGELRMFDKTDSVISHYGKTLSGGTSSLFADTRNVRRTTDKIGPVKIAAMYFNETNIFKSRADLVFFVRTELIEPVEVLRFSLTIFDHLENPVGSSFSREYTLMEIKDTENIRITLPRPNFAPGMYFITIAVGKGNQHSGYKNYDVIQHSLDFEVVPETTGTKSNASVWISTWGRIEFDDLVIN